MVRGRADRARGERGFALLLALFVALMASAAMMLAVTALKVEWDETRNEARRIRLDAMVDAAIAETLADRYLFPVDRRPFAGGWIESRLDRRPAGRAVVTALAGLGGRVQGARVEIVVTATHPRVLSWSPMPAFSEGPLR